MRIPPWKWVLPAVAVLSLAGASFGAETVRLRHVRSLYADANEMGLRSPEGVGCDDQGHLLVADSGNGRLVRFTLVGETMAADKEIKVPEISFPVRVQINSKGEIFVLDGRQQRIVRLSARGEYIGRVEAGGAPPPATVIPRSFAIGKDDVLYILDVFAGRVLVLTPEGKFSRQVDFPKEYVVMSDLAVDGRGDLYLLDSVQAMVYVSAQNSGQFSPLTGSMKERMKFPSTVATDGKGNLYLSDKNAGVVFILGLDGSFKGEQLNMGWKEGLLRYPSQLCVNDKGELFIADRENNRIQEFSTAR